MVVVVFFFFLLSFLDGNAAGCFVFFAHAGELARLGLGFVFCCSICENFYPGFFFLVGYR